LRNILIAKGFPDASARKDTSLVAAGLAKLNDPEGAWTHSPAMLFVCMETLSAPIDVVKEAGDK